MDELQKKIQDLIAQQNSQPRLEFEGLSSSELHYLLYDFFHPECPIQINILPEEEYLEIPLFSQIKYLLQRIAEKEMKLTKTGNLPVKLVAELYNLGHIKDDWIEKGIAKLYNEDRVPGIIITRLILETSSLVKKRNNKLSLTKKGLSILDDNRLLFQELFRVAVLKYNWSYLDTYNDDQSGQFGFGFSLYLLHKYAAKERTADFYAEKYFRAFPRLLEGTGEPEKYSFNAYIWRTFRIFLSFHGLVEMSPENYRDPSLVRTTPLFHRLTALKQLPGTN